jgi:hypothetical protein
MMESEAKPTRRNSMSTPAPAKFSNQNDIHGATLALAALNITHPEPDDEYGDMASQIMEDYCPLLRVPVAALTPEEEELADEIMDTIRSEAEKIETELLSSGSPMIQALAGRRPATAK